MLFHSFMFLNHLYRRKLGNKLLLLLLLCVISGGALCGQIYADSIDIQVSRRLANLPFILWTVSMFMYIPYRMRIYT